MVGFNLINIIINVPITLIALTGHEFAHGWVSTKLGDPTPEREGRLTLNPLAHLDPVGTLLMILTGFGWAKPVGVNPSYYKDTKKGMALISAILHVLCIKLGFGTSVLNGVATFAQLFAIRNLCFMVFNIIPIPPLDGAKVLGMFLTNKAYYTMLRYERYSMLLIMVLSLTGVLNGIIGTGVNFFFNGIINLLNSAINLIL